MSSFGGSDLFGSGSHQILVGPEDVMHKISGFTGANGVTDTGLGGRGRAVSITGVLRADTAAGLRTLIEDIEDDIRDDAGNGPLSLVDDFAVTYTDVRLLNLQLTSPILITGEGKYRITYRLTGRQMFV